jgi:PKHD-type hydroxylase
MLSFNPYEKSEITYPYCWLDETFTKDELQAISDYCQHLELKKGVVVGEDGGPADSEKRDSDIHFLQPDNVNYWIFEKLGKSIEFINDKYYGYELTGFDAIQYTVYGTKGSKYDWHMDMITGTNKARDMIQTRKLSIIMPLAEPNEYEGGEFQIQTGVPEEPLTIEQVRGRLIAFPGFMLHRVTPITAGIRKSLVLWCVGPKFK